MCNINLRCSANGREALHYAAEAGDSACIEVLLGAQAAEVDAKDEFGRTPLSWAAENGHERVVKALLATGKVEVDSKDGGGRTPQWRAAPRRHAF
ncbi:hypothetical protein LTR95_013836 [Oleoguttula sp. CCFEE 5521]